MGLICKIFGHKMMPKLGQPQRTCLRCSHTIGKTYEEMGIEHPIDIAVGLLEGQKNDTA